MADGIPTWEEVARDHGRFLYTVAYRLAGNEYDAQDLVHHTADHRLVLHEQDDCLIHPMFYRKLHVRSSANLFVHPFPDHPDFDPLK